MLTDDDVETVAETFGMPMILTGDNFQRKPVKAAMNHYMVNAGINLTECKRSIGEIVRMCLKIRNFEPLPKDIDTEAIQRFTMKTLMNSADHYDLFMESDQIIASKNDTCDAWNKRYRDWAGYEGDLPEIGEKLNVTMNHRDSNLMNGTFVEVDKIHNVFLTAGYMTLDVYSATDDKVHKNINFSLANYDADVRERVYWKSLMKYVNSKWGYCVTIDSFQGSEGDYISIIEDDFGSREDKASSLYTKWTRACEGIISVRLR